MRDTRDASVIGAEIIRLVGKGWKVRDAAQTVCPPLSREPQGGPSDAPIPNSPYGFRLDLSGAEAAAEGEA